MCVCVWWWGGGVSELNKQLLRASYVPGIALSQGGRGNPRIFAPNKLEGSLRREEPPYPFLCHLLHTWASIMGVDAPEAVQVFTPDRQTDRRTDAAPRDGPSARSSPQPTKPAPLQACPVRWGGDRDGSRYFVCGVLTIIIF